MSERPDFIRHWRDLEGEDDSHYDGDTELQAIGIFHVPEPERPEDFHIGLCAATDRPIPANDDGVVPGIIPGGRCAVLRVVGVSDDLGPAATCLYREWLPASGEETRDFPLYCQRMSFFPDVPDHEAVTDLYLPLR